MTLLQCSVAPNIRPDDMQKKKKKKKNKNKKKQTKKKKKKTTTKKKKKKKKKKQQKNTHTYTHQNQNNKKRHSYLRSEKINRNVKYSGIVSILFQRLGSVVILKHGFENRNRTSFHSCLRLVKPKSWTQILVQFHNMITSVYRTMV